MAGARRAAAVGAHLHENVEQTHQPANRGRVELAKRLLGRIPDLAKDRTAEIDRAAAFPPPHDRAAATIRLPDHAPRESRDESQTHGVGHGEHERALERRQFSHHPLGRVFPRTFGDQPIRLTLLTQEAEHRRQRRQADTAVAQTGRVQPRFVELQTRRQDIGDALVEARNEQTSDAGVIHGVMQTLTAKCRLNSAVHILRYQRTRHDFTGPRQRARARRARAYGALCPG